MYSLDEARRDQVSTEYVACRGPLLAHRSCDIAAIIQPMNNNSAGVQEDPINRHSIGWPRALNPPPSPTSADGEKCT